MEFFVTFADDTALWVPWSPDLFASLPYEEFCRLHRELFPLIFTVTESKKQISEN
jgi:hypothetical protein